MSIQFLQIFIYFLLILLFPLNHKIHAVDPSSSFVTYEFSGGRFGDNLLTYLHAKWISYSFGIPLLYQPFPYSSLLLLDDTELQESDVYSKRLNSINLSTHPKIQPHFHLYVCPYFPESPWERHKTKGCNGQKWFYFDVDWTNPEFRQIVKNLISPKNPCQLTIPPKGQLGVAIHVRNGGGFDESDAGLRNPTKFPPIDFYIDALQKVIALFREMEIYCFLFTDALDPQLIVKQIKAAISPKVPITFDCRSKDNAHNRNVLEDFFSLFYFDVLIHPDSNFSIIPSLLHDYAIVCTPLDGYSVGSKITIDRVNFKINEISYKESRKKCLSN